MPPLYKKRKRSQTHRMVNRVKLFPFAYNSPISTTFGLPPYKIVFYQKPRKPIMFTAISSKNAQGHCQPTRDSSCYNSLLHAEDLFLHPRNLKLASETHTEWNLLRYKNNEIYQKIAK